MGRGIVQHETSTGSGGIGIGRARQDHYLNEMIAKDHISRIHELSSLTADVLLDVRGSQLHEFDPCKGRAA